MIVLSLAVCAACFADQDDGGSAGDQDGGEDGADGTGGDDGGDSGGTGSGSGDSGGSGDGGSSGDGGETSTDTGQDQCDAGSKCVDAPPPDWMGPTVLFSGAPDSAPPCADAYPSMTLEAFSEPIAPPASCQPCACSDPTGIECEGPAVHIYYGGQCNSERSMFKLPGHDQCLTFTNPDGTGSANTDPVVPRAGTGACEASGGGATVPAWQWGKHLVACGGGATTGACGDGMCMPVVEAPWQPALCIVREGDHTCPGGSYVNKQVFFRTASDDRDCSACSCGAPGGATCDALVELHFNPSCSNLGGTITNPGNECLELTQFNNPPLSGKMIVRDVVGGQCFAAGGEPTGGVMPGEPVTVCCTS